MTVPFLKQSSSLAVLAALAVLVLSGCALSPGPTPDPSSTSQPVETEAPTPAPEVQAGDIITAEEAAEMNAAWGRLTDDKAYQLPSGEYAVIKGGAPLPPNVAEAVNGAIIPPVSVTTHSSQFNAAEREAANAAIEAQEAATGRQVVTVIHAMNYVQGGGEVAAWSVGGKTEGYNGPDKATALAVAQKWVDQSPSTRILIVVDALG